MKRLNKFLGIILAATCLLAFALIFAACSDNNDDSNKPTEYTITLMLNEEQEWDTFTGKKGSTIEFAKSNPNRPNSNFKGWSEEPDGEVTELPTVMPASNKVYYAVFARYYVLTLRAGDGTLSGDSKISAELGQSLYSIVKDIVPAAPGVAKFDGWYYGNKKIDATATDDMPAHAISLDAKYTVDYTINIYKQAEYNKDGYNEVVADKVSNTGFIGSSPSGNEYPAYTGYELNEEKSGATADFVLSATGTNVYNAYYNIQSYSLVFNANAPENTYASGSMGTKIWGYDVEDNLPDCNYYINGYRFMYWSTKADGSDRLDAGDKYSITDTTTLYAVWTRGYSDINGRSADYIYLVENKNGSVSAYLDRYYLDELEGTYDPAAQTVTFKTENNEPVLYGKLDLDGYTFVNISTQAYVLHKLNDSSGDINGYLEQTTTLTLSENGNAVYTVDSAAVSGKYSFVAAEYSLKFTATDSDDTFYFRLSQFTADDGTVSDVFEVRSEVEIGDWCRLNDDDSLDTKFVLTFNGYGEAVMHATGEVPQRNTANYSGYYRFGSESTEDKIEIYTIFVTAYGSESSRIAIVDRTATSAADAQYTKFYKERSFSSTVYAKPENPDDELTDGITLDGYGLYADSATFTRGGNTVTGKYTMDWNARLLVIDPADGSADISYFLDSLTVGEGDEATTYITYEPIQSKNELNVYYTITGIESNFRPGIAYGYRFFNDNTAMLYIIMPDYNQAFNTMNYSLVPIVLGEYHEIEGSSGEYLMTADITPEMAAVVSLYYTQLLGFSSPLNLNAFSDFKFKLTSSNAGEATALRDGYEGIEIVDNGATYVTDGYGKATVTNNQGIVTDTRNYVVSNAMGLTFITFTWEEKKLNDKNEEVTEKKQKSYAFIGGEYREYLDVYSKYNTQYSAQIPDTSFGFMLFDGDYASLVYSNNNVGALILYSWGKVTWTDSGKNFGAYEELGVMESLTGDVLRQLYGDFKFGFKYVTVENKNGTTTTYNYIFTYDANASGVVDGKFTVAGENGATLTLDLNKAEAEYSVPDATAEGGKTTIKGEFKLREGVLTIVYTVDGEDEQTYIGNKAFKLIYEGGEVSSFKPIGMEVGTWQDGSGMNGTLTLTGEAAEAEGEYVGTWMSYDRATDDIIAITGTYKLTDNTQITEYEFKYTVEPDESIENDDGKRSVNFALGYDANRLPIYRMYTIPVSIILYSSITSTMPVYQLSGGGYNDLILLDSYSNRTVGQLLVYPNVNLGMKGAVLYAFGTNSHDPQPLLFFTSIVNEDESVRWVVLDGTFSNVNFGFFECDDDRVLTVPVENKDSGKYENKDIVVDRIFFNGLGFAMLISGDDVYTVMYMRYSTSTYVLVSGSGKNISIIAQFRLYTRTQEVPSEDEEGEPTTETHYLVRFNDAELTNTFVGAGYTAFITDGFGSAAYVDKYGVPHTCVISKLADHPEVIEVTYLNGLSIAYMYIEVDAENKTFTVLESDDERIPAEEDPPEDDEQVPPDSDE